MSSNFEIRKEVMLEATPQQVWQAIATPEGQAAWSPDPYASQEDLLVDRDPPARLTIRTPEAPNGALHAFEFIIEAREGSTTVLRFVHSGFLGNDWDSEFNYEELTSYGWDLALHTLAQRQRIRTIAAATLPGGTGPAPNRWRLPRSGRSMICDTSTDLPSEARCDVREVLASGFPLAHSLTEAVALAKTVNGATPVHGGRSVSPRADAGRRPHDLVELPVVRDAERGQVGQLRRCWAPKTSTLLSSGQVSSTARYDTGRKCARRWKCSTRRPTPTTRMP